jgi:NTP pyrophosphatase (non-canonical NTP hydrolase)
MAIISHAKGELDEVADEIALGDAAEHQALESELGDLLFNTMLLIKLCERDGLGGATLEGAAASASAKLRRRAPFIFGEGQRPQTPAEANAIWKSVKKQEKAGTIDTTPMLLSTASPQYLGGMMVGEEENQPGAGDDIVHVGRWTQRAESPKWSGSPHRGGAQA